MSTPTKNEEDGSGVRQCLVCWGAAWVFIILGAICVYYHISWWIIGPLLYASAIAFSLGLFLLFIPALKEQDRETPDRREGE